MGKDKIVIAPNAYYSLQSASPFLLEINEGAVLDAYYVERIADGIGNRLFLLELKGPVVVGSFPVNDLFDVILATHQSEISVTKWAIEDFANSTDVAGKSKMVDAGIMGLLSTFPDIVEPPDAISFDRNTAQVTVGGIYVTPTPHELFWIANLPKDTRFLGETELDKFSAALFPMTRQIYYHFANSGKVSVFNTVDIVQNKELLLKLIDLNKLLDHYYGKAYVTATFRKHEQVRSGYHFRRDSVENSLNHLGTIIDDEIATNNFISAKTLPKKEDIPVKRENHSVKENALLDICKLIGKYEGITFREGFKSINKKDEPLKTILRASNIRSRRVYLSNIWWDNNHGALLGYLKSDNTPVALIPKGNTSYILHDLRSKMKIKVTPEVAGEISDKAFSFFTPFPTTSPKTKDLIKLALQFSKIDVIMFLVIGVIGALLSLLIPITTGYIFNKVIPGGQVSELVYIGSLFILGVVAIGIMNFTKSLSVQRFEGKASFKLQSALWDRILSLKVPFFSIYNPGDLAERSLGIEKIRTILSASVMGAISSLIFSLSYLGLMFYYDVRLAVLALVLGSTVALFTFGISASAYKYVANIRRSEAIISGFMMMVIRGIAKIRLTDSKEKVFGIWAEKFALQKEQYIKKQHLLIGVSVFTFVFPILASLCIYIRIYHLLMDPAEGFHIGDFMAFNTAYLAFQGALIQTCMVTVPLLTIKPTYELFKPILQADMEEYDGKSDPGQLNGGIEVKNLFFKYKDSHDWILKDINLKINPGEFVALAGSSGSGKSTLYRILLGFEAYSEGSVLFDGHELHNVDIRIIRDQLGVVLQNGKIMQGTVLYNIIGNSNYTEEEAWEAARKAGCDKDINELPLKMHSILPPGGGTLSGGQQQRIVIARALVRKPKILMFDEATSALDNETQQIVSDNIEKLKATRIVIAHRLSTIMHADRIIVMDKGRVVEEGTFVELTEKEGFFHDLVKGQII